MKARSHKASTKRLAGGRLAGGQRAHTLAHHEDSTVKGHAVLELPTSVSIVFFVPSRLRASQALKCAPPLEQPAL
jgi:hypothetical protein